MKAWVIGWGCVVGVFGLSASAADPGAELYKKHCAVCHGEKGNGQSRVQGSLNPPPRDFTATAAREELSRERMLTSVTYGRPGTAMMAFSTRLDEAARGAVVDYIRREFMQIKGGASRGQQLYKRHCAACHGENGNTAMWAQSGLNPPPRNFTDPASREELTLERMVASVTYGRPGTAMMPFAKRLNAAEIKEVVHYVRSTFMPVPVASPTQAPTPRLPRIDMAAAMPHGLRGDLARGEAFYQANCFHC
ncbi:MAG: c-type cytochrome, partial [Gammaproteobacteria bacterium]|nr:c-type cytochrome [Gammaproteobacteria bacterium]